MLRYTLDIHVYWLLLQKKGENGHFTDGQQGLKYLSKVVMVIVILESTEKENIFGLLIKRKVKIFPNFPLSSAVVSLSMRCRMYNKVYILGRLMRQFQQIFHLT